MSLWEFLRTLPPYFRPHRRVLALLVVAVVISLVFETGFPLGIKYLIDLAIVPRDSRLLVIVLSVLAAAALLASVTAFLQDFAYARVETRVLNDIRLKMFRHLQRLSMGYFSRSQAGDIMARFSSDLGAVESAVVSALPSSFVSLLGFILSAAILLTIEWRLTLLAVAGTIVAFRLARLLEPRACAANAALKEAQAGISTELQENLGAQSVIKGFQLQEHATRRFESRCNDFSRIAIRTSLLGYLVQRIPNVGVLVLGIILLGLCAFLTFRGEMSVGDLVAFNGLFLELSGCVTGLTWSVPQLLEAGAGMQRIQGLLRIEPEIVDAPTAVPLPLLEKAVEFQGVTFGYGGSAPNLRNVSFTVPRGVHLAVVGSSGSGKSTVLNLLMRFYDPVAGSVCFDGTPLPAATQESLRAQLGVVFQESFLFDTSIRENIRIGRSEATDAEVEEAARIAGVHGFAMRLPQGYDSVVGERGGLLSGGQRQRIGIARAILRDPAILLLDEATSALDPQTEAELNETLADVTRDRTVISVTHRLTAASRADQVLVMEGGRLVEQGTHQELLSRGGAYARLWEKQAGFTLGGRGERATIAASRLRGLPVLSELDATLLEEAARLFVTEHVPAGRVIIREGEPGDKFYVIVHGRVTVYHATAPGGDRFVATLEDGDYFGEIALLRSMPRTASVRALSPGVLLSLQRDQFLDLVRRVPDLQTELEQRVLERLVSMKPTAFKETGPCTSFSSS